MMVTVWFRVMVGVRVRVRVRGLGLWLGLDLGLSLELGLAVVNLCHTHSGIENSPQQVYTIQYTTYNVGQMQNFFIVLLISVKNNSCLLKGNRAQCSSKACA